MKNKKIRYTVYKNKVWLELLYKGAVMNQEVVYNGSNHKDCERWIKENVKED